MMSPPLPLSLLLFAQVLRNRPPQQLFLYTLTAAGDLLPCFLNTSLLSE